MSALLFAITLETSMWLGAYPIPRDGFEQPLYWEEPLAVTGQWSIDGDRLSHAQANGRQGIIVHGAPSPEFLRVEVPQRLGLEFTLLFRTRIAQKEPLRIAGYGLMFNGRKGELAFARWDPGDTKDPGVRQKGIKLRGKGPVEVCLWMGGANFVAVVYDGVTKAVLATLAWSDATYSQGHVGVFAKRPTKASLRFSAVVGDPPGGTEFHTWLAPEWLAVFSPEAIRRAPTEVTGLLTPIQEPLPQHQGLVFRASEAALAAMAGQGIVPILSHPGVPHMYRLPAARRASTERLYAQEQPLRLSSLPKTPDTIETILKDLVQRFPSHAHLEAIGKSSEGRPLWALHLADDLDDRSRPAVLLCAAHHANEASTPEYPLDAALHILNQLDQEAVQGWLSALRLVFVPMVNPDGSHFFWHQDDQGGRKNRRRIHDGVANPGVDLNRNYPFAWGGPELRFNSNYPESNFYRGPHAASEPEVQSMMALAERHRFVAAISYHAAATRILVPYTIPGVKQPTPSTAWNVAHAMVEQLPQTFGNNRKYEAVGALYAVDGTEQDWYLHRFGTLAYLLEVPYRRPPEELLARAVEHSRPAWQYLLNRWLAGPSLSVEVTDVSGKPLDAQVQILEVQLHAGEEWRTDPRTGWFHHYLPEPGRYQIRVIAGSSTQEQVIDATSGVARVRFRFPRAPSPHRAQ